MSDNEWRDETDGVRTLIDSGASLVAAIASIMTVVVSLMSFIMMWQISVSANEIAEAQNEIALTQAIIEENSFSPEFVYLGPEVTLCEQENTFEQPEGYYDYGFEPRFAKISGLAKDLSCEAYDHFELEITNTNLSNKPASTVAVHFCGAYSSCFPSLEESFVVVGMLEMRTICEERIHALIEELENRGYQVRVLPRPLCVGNLVYLDVTGDEQKRPFTLDLETKYLVDFGEEHEACCSDPVVMELVREESNKGIGEGRLRFWVNEVISRL